MVDLLAILPYFVGFIVESVKVRTTLLKMVSDFRAPGRDVTNQTPPEYVILDDFNFTRGRLYPG